MRPRHSAAAFTLVELLVVLAVVGVLAALLLAAVQRAREAAGRVKCAGNLAQLGRALHAYHESNERYPQAYNEYWTFCPPTDSPEPPDPRPRKSWVGFILPYVEQDAIQAGGAAKAQQSPVPVFLCPSDPRSQVVSTGGSFDFLGSSFGLTSYLAVEGSSYDYGTADTYLNLELGGAKDGVIYRSSETRQTDITDGSSNTLLLGERPPMTAGSLDWGWWAWTMYDSALAVVDRRELASTGCANPAVYGPGTADEPCDTLHFWSLHPGGANWLFADGSVRFLRYGAAAVLPALASRNGGDPAGGF